MNGKRWGPQLSPDKRRGKSKVIDWALVMLWSLPKTGLLIGPPFSKELFLGLEKKWKQTYPKWNMGRQERAVKQNERGLGGKH